MPFGLAGNGMAKLAYVLPPSRSRIACARRAKRSCSSVYNARNGREDYLAL